MAGGSAAGSLLYLAALDGEGVAAVDAVAAIAGAAGGLAADSVRDGAAGHGELAVIADAVTAVLAAGSCIAALHGSDFGVVLDGELAVVVDAVAGAAAVGGAAGSVIDAGLPGDGERTGADAVAGVTAAVAAVAVAAGGADNVGFAGDGEVAVAVDAATAVVGAMALAALRCFDGAALNVDGNIFANAAAADACAAIAADGFFDGAALDVDGSSAGAIVTAANAGSIAAALGFYDGVAPDVDGSIAGAVVTAADASAVLRGLRIDFGSAIDDDMGVAGSIATAANAGSIVAAGGGDVAACYLNGAGAIVVAEPAAADTSRATAACGSQAAGVAAIGISGCDGQFAGVAAAIIVLSVVLEAGALVAAGQLVVAHERDFGVARALDAEGGVVGLAGIDVDIVQRHVEGVVVARGLVDDSDDVVGDVFGCVLEVFRSTLQDRGRFVPGLFVVIGAGDLEGCTGVCELAFGRRAVALRAFRAFGRGGSAAGLGVVFLAAGAAVLRAGGAVRAGAAALRAGGAAVRAFTLRVRASRTGVLAVGGVTGLGLFRGLVLVFLAAAVRRVAALGVAGVDHVFVFVFAVFYFERGRRGFGGRGCRGAAFGRAAAGGAAFGRTGAGVGVFGGVGSCSALDNDIVVLVLFAELVCITCFIRALDIDVAFSVFGDCDVAAVVVNIICTRIRRCGHAGHHCGCQCQRRHPVRRGPGGVCRHPQRMPQNAHCKLAIRDHGNLL